MKNSLLVSISALALLTSPAYAVDLSDAKGLELKNALQSYVDRMANMSSEDIGYKFKGDISVTTADGYFKATLPHITYQMADEGHFDFGVVAINALPVDKQGQWKMAVSIPTKMVAYDSDKTPALTLTLKDQKFGGIFDEKFKNFTAVKASYSDVTAKFKDEQGAAVIVSMPQISMDQKFSEDKEGLFSGPYDYALNDMSVTVDNQKMFSANTLSINGMMEDFDISSQQKLDDMGKKMMKNPENPDPKVITDMLSEIYLNSVNAFTMNMAMKDVTINIPKKGETASDTMMLSHANFALGANDLKGEKAGIDLAWGYTVPQAQIKNGNSVESLIPSKAKFDISLRNVPVKKISDTMTASLESGGNTADTLKMQAMMNLPQMLTAAGAQIKINDLSTTGNGYNAHISGSVFANAQAMMQATANIKAKFEGLGSILSKLNSIDPSDPQAAQAKQAVGTLTMLQMMGQQDGDKDIRTYDFKLTEQGQMMLNGSDLSAMMGMTGAPQ